MEDWTCDYCGHEGPDCMATTNDEDMPYYCTKAEGHDGPHVACGGAGCHEIVTWDDNGNVAWYGERLKNVGEPK